MTLTLLAVSLNDKPLSQPITAHFGAEGGTIGRADHNTMALPDPERHISRLQAEIVAGGGNFQIRNVGAANPIVVDGRQLAQGESIALKHGNEVRIGGYQLKVLDDSDSERTGGDITRGRAAVAAAANTPRLPRSSAIGVLPEVEASPLSNSNPFADLLGAGAAPAAAAPLPAKAAVDDPFADLLPPPAGVSAGSAASRPMAPPAARLPDDFDPMAAPMSPARPRPAVPLPSDDPFAGLLAPATSPSIDKLIDFSATPGDDPLAAFMAGAAPASSGGRDAPGGLSTDPLALFGLPSTPAAAAPTASDHAPALQEAFSPPRAARPEMVEPFDGDETRLPPSRIAARQSAPPSPPPPRPLPPAAPPPPAIVDQPVPVPVPAAVARPAPPAVAAPAPAAVAPAPVREGPEVSSLFGSLFAPTGPNPNAKPPLAPEGEALPPASPAPAAAQALLPTVGAESAADREALWAAFCAGTGVRMDLPGGLTPEMMNIIGQILVNALSGTLRLMAVRANVKQEMRAHMTVIQARANNPLKFSPDARAGLEQLLKPPMRGFLPGPAAMTDAMHDLVGHSIGTVAGMRAALDGVLGRFEPAALEAKLSGKSLLDAVLPMNRKARLWELYLQHFESIRNEAQDDFHTLFGKAFLAAYEQQLDRLHEESSAR